MCEYCGCRQMAPIAELMDEHLRLMELAGDARRCLSAGDRATAVAHLRLLAGYLDRHVRREETGVFAALRDQGEFLDEVELLEKEHQTFDEQVAALDPEATDFEDRVATLLRELDEHVERENLGIFPVSVVTLRAAGWDTVNRAHADSPSFLRGAAESA